MLNLIRVLLMPSVCRSGLSKLPRKSGVYYWVSLGKVKYIGLSTNIHSRWNNTNDWQHKWRNSFLKDRFARLHYCEMGRDMIDYYERIDILRFNPPLNIVKADPKKVRTGKIFRKELLKDFYWIMSIAAILLVVYCLVA